MGKANPGKSRWREAPYPRYAFAGYLFLIVCVFVDIQLFLSAWNAAYLHVHEDKIRLLLISGGVLLLFCGLLYFLLKRLHADLYREQAFVLYVGTLILLPFAQWFCHYLIYDSVFETFLYAPPTIGQIVLIALWWIAIVIHLATEGVGYRPHPDRDNWSCNIYRAFRTALRMNDSR